MYKGIAYGSLGGIAVTLCESRDYRQLVFATHFDDPASLGAVMGQLASRDLKKEFGITKYEVKGKTIQVFSEPSERRHSGCRRS